MRIAAGTDDAGFTTDEFDIDIAYGVRSPELYGNAVHQNLMVLPLGTETIADGRWRWKDVGWSVDDTGRWIGPAAELTTDLADPWQLVDRAGNPVFAARDAHTSEWEHSMEDETAPNQALGATRIVLQLAVSQNPLPLFKRKAKSFSTFDIQKSPTRRVALRLRHRAYAGVINAHDGAPGVLIFDVPPDKGAAPTMMISAFVGVLLRSFDPNIRGLTITPVD